MIYLQGYKEMNDISTRIQRNEWYIYKDTKKWMIYLQGYKEHILQNKKYAYLNKLIEQQLKLNFSKDKYQMLVCISFWELQVKKV